MAISFIFLGILIYGLCEILSEIPISDKISIKLGQIIVCCRINFCESRALTELLIFANISFY